MDIKYPVDDIIENNIPISEDNIFNNCITYPELPDGLKIDNKCIISGKPTELSPKQLYVISGEIDGSIVNTTILLEVMSSILDSDIYIVDNENKIQYNRILKLNVGYSYKFYLKNKNQNDKRYLFINVPNIVYNEYDNSFTIIPNKEVYDGFINCMAFGNGKNFISFTIKIRVIQTCESGSLHLVRYRTDLIPHKQSAIHIKYNDTSMLLYTYSEGNTTDVFSDGACFDPGLYNIIIEDRSSDEGFNNYTVYNDGNPVAHIQSPRRKRITYLITTGIILLLFRNNTTYIRIFRI